jgi:hypothetical protein
MWGDGEEVVMERLARKPAHAVAGALAMALWAGGCNGPDTGQYGYAGYVMEDFFPFDGQRSWEFVNDDASLPYKLTAALDPVYEEQNEGVTRVFTIEYAMECVSTDAGCEDGPYRTRYVKMSSDSTYGTLLYGYDSEASGPVQFSPPVVFTDANSKVGQVEETETGGTTWTSTFSSIEPCPVKNTDQWDECVHFVLDDGGAGTPLAGEYWAVAGYNVVAMQLAEDAEKWQLLNTVYSAE